MDQSRYFVRGRTYPSGDPSLQDALARVYDSSERPRCMCVQGGVEMYVAKHAEFVIKRMPGTGHLHHVACHSFELEVGVSGIGELMGEAIVEHAPEQVEIRTAFPLARVGGKPLPRGEPTDVAFLELAHGLHAGGAELALATHDPVLREALLRALPGLGVEMSLGVRSADATALARRGVPVRIYLPYGDGWFRYAMRRWAESVGR